MSKKNILKRINSFLKGKASLSEQIQLRNFLDSYQTDDFSWKPEYGNQSEIEKNLYKKIQSKISEKENRKKPVRRLQFLPYAAAIASVIGLAVCWEYAFNSELDKAPGLRD